MKRIANLTIGFIFATATYADFPTTLPDRNIAPPAKDVVQKPIPLGKDTTYFDKPVTTKGFVDYLSIFNATFGKDVTAENNAMVPILQAIGTSEISKDRLKLLQMAPCEGAFNRKWAPPPHFDADRILKDVEEFAVRRWKAKDHLDLVAWLNENEKALTLMTSAASRDRFYWPCVSRDGTASNSTIPPMYPVRLLTNGLLCRAMYRLDASDTRGCRADIIAVHRIARHFTFDWAITADIGLSIEKSAWICEGILAGSEKLTAAEIKEHRSAIEAMPKGQPTADIVETRERCGWLEIVTLAMRDGVERLQLTLEQGDPLRDIITDDELNQADPAVVLKRMNAYFDKVVAAMREKDLKKRVESLAASEKVEAPDPKDRMPEATRDSYAADAVLALAAKRWSGRQNPELANSCQAMLADVAFALAAYKLENKNYPDKLEPLAPNFLKEIPNDPFNGKSLHYIKTEKGFVLYSVGPNFKDDHGVNVGKFEIRDIALSAEAP